MLSDEPVIAIDCDARLALLEDGTVCPGTNMLDVFGDETDDSDSAVSAVCRLPDGRWCAIDLKAFSRESMH